MINELEQKKIDSRTIKTALEDAARVFVKVWPLQNFIACNPLSEYEHLDFDSALDASKLELGWVDRLEEKDFRHWYEQGAMTLQGIEAQFERCSLATLATCFELEDREIRLKDILRADLIATLKPPIASNSDIILKMLLKTIDFSSKQGEGNVHTDRVIATIQGVELLTGEALSKKLDEHTVKWLSAYLDKGQAIWSMPNRHLGLRVAWQNLVVFDNSLSHESRKVLKRLFTVLPKSPYEALGVLLDILEVPVGEIKSYMRWHLGRLPGWVGYVRWHVEQMDRLHDADETHRTLLADYLIMRLCTELALCKAVLKKDNQCDATLIQIRDCVKTYRINQGLKKDFGYSGEMAYRLTRIRHELSLSMEQMEILLQNDGKEIIAGLNAFDHAMKSKIFRESMEITYQNNLLEKIKQNMARPAISIAENKPLMQAVFCIDNRSEQFRLKLEACGMIQTLGFAGFFGIPTRLRAYGENFSKDLCPVLMTPRYAIEETPLENKTEEATHYLKIRQRFFFIRSIFQWLMKNIAGMFAYVEAFGLGHAVLMLMKTLFPQQIQYPAFHEVRPQLVLKVTTPHRKDGLVEGITLEERTYYAEAALTMMGLTSDFSPVVVFCGHGSQTENNPYQSSLDCGACGGNAGGASARVLSTVLNDATIRDNLAMRGINIPEETVFLAAEHNTVTDEVTFLNFNQYKNRISIPIEPLLEAFKQASYLNRQTRTALLPAMMQNPISMNATDWSQVRPEWGTAGNAAMIVGPRSLTEKLDLKGRAFLHSYDWQSDLQGKSLEAILTGALVVAQWINAQYLFSTLDNNRFGSGSKTIHNLVGRFGVMRGNASDLQIGLPLQTLMTDYASPYHTPLRLTAIVCAPWQTIDRIIRRHALLRNLFKNQWIYLVAIDLESSMFLTYVPDGSWKAWPEGLSIHDLSKPLEILQTY